MISLLAIGKKHEDWVGAGIERYQKRLKPPYDAKWTLLAHSSLAGDTARQEESERLLMAIKPDDFVVLLDETGTAYDSPGLAELAERQFTGGKRLVMVIGGAYGVDERLKQRADIIWSLSPLVFPHQLVRLIVVEQLYRCQQISRGGSYHHE